MNKWLSKTLELAHTGNYYDRLHEIYPIATEENIKRQVSDEKWLAVENSFDAKNNIELIKSIFKLTDTGKFPFKTSYIRYFYNAKISDPEFFNRNPKTVKIIANRLYKLGLEGIKNGVIAPKEHNQQSGALFKNFLEKNDFPIKKLFGLSEFETNKNDAILIGSDEELKTYAKENCGYKLEKGLDVIIRISKKYYLGEAKWITDDGGNQSKSFLDALNSLVNGVDTANADIIMILDGTCYRKSKGKTYMDITTKYKEINIMSALFLKEFIEEKLNETSV
tara:strand:- start:47 stop:883 length:837 start_codon:yes stop_codon:yes gene_type:complete